METISYTKNEYFQKVAITILYLVAIVYTLQYLGTIFHSDLVKYISVILDVYLLYLSGKIVLRNRDEIDWQRFIPVAAVLFIYPFVRVVFDVLSAFTLKAFTDGFIVYAGYYELSLVAISLVSISKYIDVVKLLRAYAVIAFPLGVLMYFIAVAIVGEDQSTNSGLLAMVTCFIPVATLSIKPKIKKDFIYGWLAIILIIFISSRVFSRSYTLIGIYLIFFALSKYFRDGKFYILLLVFLIFYIAYTLQLHEIFSSTAINREESISDKFQISTLQYSIDKTLSDGDLIHLFNWEGNSRRDILIDAFGKFTWDEWLFGRGVFGVYESFVLRGTIEIGLAQELFRWGYIYLFFMLYLPFRAFLKLKKTREKLPFNAVDILLPFIPIKLLDEFIYGMPEHSPYTLLFFWVWFCFYRKEYK